MNASALPPPSDDEVAQREAMLDQWAKQQPKKSWGARIGLGGALGLGVAGLIALGALSAIGGSDDDHDFSGERACRSFNSTAKDYSDGVLTLPELRDRMKDIADEAQGADNAVVRVESTRLLAALTSNLTAAPDAISRLDAACGRVLGG
jgi:hypothetical protein